MVNVGWPNGVALVGRRVGGGIMPFVNGSADPFRFGGAGDCVADFSILMPDLTGDPEWALLGGRTASGICACEVSFTAGELLVGRPFTPA